jgi:hypothetical protein
MRRWAEICTSKQMNHFITRSRILSTYASSGVRAYPGIQAFARDDATGDARRFQTCAAAAQARLIT